MTLTINELINGYGIKLKDIEILAFDTRGYALTDGISIVNLGDSECIMFNYGCRTYYLHFDTPLISDDVIFRFNASDTIKGQTDSTAFGLIVSQRVLFEMLDEQIY
ncbi:hypothetical protein [Campylobacter sp. 19-13652]|uniref:hypothetical protein n=1 Tax=Campylobacter sp. 19-13652 TaxID=2840180 RepID=UPI001C7547D0|nr:hypothetical protein [Campylobacter sp. 19-13652]BCX79226.1 hypothetical protein LBC_06880 [Campylobacter sp. 19-13652]